MFRLLWTCLILSQSWQMKPLLHLGANVITDGPLLHLGPVIKRYSPKLVLFHKCFSAQHGRIFSLLPKCAGQNYVTWHALHDCRKLVCLFHSCFRSTSLGNLRWWRFRGDGDRTGRESLELRQPSLPVKNRTLRSQWTQKDGSFN